ncbi:TetR/AcrR family transcriptional regulator [Nocardia blacklockiae]|uniref:TetR/AcrR family transcriptional regulator n=1 Tax=Nocardia blacklockiae TaxID=480036 RepID=UPI00189346F1|nr:TetR/AcrR family transcriptional regulator [Nocardia blacklockiae]MBF6171923.1 TetR/AcrR family transcriptional regulator [Nocardia blacklockiae]
MGRTRRPAWNGSPPRDDADARARIIDAAMRCIDRRGAGRTTLSDVAADLGVIRQTVYRHFPSTEDLFEAVGHAAVDNYLDHLLDHLAGVTDPADMAIEAIAYTIERLPHDRHVNLLLSAGRPAAFTRVAMSDAAFDACRTAFDRSDVDWAAHGYAGDHLTELIEYLLRVLLSFVTGPTVRRRDGVELRRFLRRWVAPALPADRDSKQPAALHNPVG